MRRLVFALVCGMAYKGMKTFMPQEEIVSLSPNVMGGMPVFAGTRVPVQTLLDYLEAGDTLHDFLDSFPSVRREQVVAFLHEAAKRMIASAAAQ